MPSMSGVDLSAIFSETEKIDNVAADGLLGTEGSVAYEISEVERHHHHYSRAFGLAAVPNGEVHVADEITSNPGPFTVDAGNDTWGAWIQLLGTDDTPFITGKQRYDAHLITVVAAERANTVHLIQLAAGASGAAALTAGTYSDKVFIPQSANGRPAPVPFGIRRQDAGTKLWIRTLARGADTGTLSIYLEIHEYEG